MSTSTLESTQPTGDFAGASARPKRSAWQRVLLTLALLALAAAAYLWWKRGHPGADAVSPLEATTTAGSVLVPAESEMLAQAPTSAGPASAPADAPGQDGSSPGALAQIAIAAASGSGQALDSARDVLKELTTGLGRAHARIDAVEASDRAQSEQIATLRSDVDQLKTPTDTTRPLVSSSASQHAEGAPPQAETGDRGIEVIDRAPAPTRKPRPASQRARSKSAAPAIATARARRAPSTNGAGADVLAIDTWGGKPSVALVSASDGRPELRFLAEGESHQGLVLRQADAISQRARFTSQSGELTLAPKEDSQ